MKRRNFVIGLGGLAGAGAVVGTGAFSSVTASRDFDVTVAGDASAYLNIEPTTGPNGVYADSTSSDALEVDLTGDNPTGEGGTGINANSIYYFEDVFKVQNQGTQEVEIDVAPILFFDADANFDDLVLAVLVPSLGTFTQSVGEELVFDILALSFDTDDDPPIDLNSEFTITAEET